MPESSLVCFFAPSSTLALANKTSSAETNKNPAVVKQIRSNIYFLSAAIIKPRNS